MNPSQSPMSKFPSLCEQYFLLVDTESASHSGMLVDFGIGGSPDEYLFSSILLYLARNVLISRSSLISWDPVMNTFEHTRLLFFCISLAMYMYVGEL